MDGADLVELTESARRFGIPADPPAVDLRRGPTVDTTSEPGRSWPRSAGAIAAVAALESWTLDLRDDAPQPDTLPRQLNRYVSETLAAHAAVVLAKTQATAARAESQATARELASTSDQLAQDRQALTRTNGQLQEVREMNAKLEHDRAVAEAKAEEVRAQLALERSQRAYMAQQMNLLEQERLDLYSSLGWFGRRRLRRTRS